MEEIRKEDEMNDHEFQREAEREAEDATVATAEDVELPEELVDSLGMISLANAAELHRGGKEGNDGGNHDGVESSNSSSSSSSCQHPLPPASTLLNLSAAMPSSDHVLGAPVTTASSSSTLFESTTSFAAPIEVVTTENDDRNEQLDLAGQMAQLANYSYAMGNMPSNAFDYLRLYDSQVLNNNSVILDNERNDQNAFSTNGFYEFQR